MKSKLLEYFLWVFMLIVLLIAALYGFAIAGYIIYTNFLVYFTIAAFKKKLVMGPVGEELWVGKKVVFFSLFVLSIFILVGLQYENKDYFLFLASSPLGLILGLWGYKVLTSGYPKKVV